MKLDTAALDRADLPRPDISVEDAAIILRNHYGLEGEIVELGSQQDRNFRVDTGERRCVLKICRSEYAAIELEAQNAALRHLGAMENMPRVPDVLTSHDGKEIWSLTLRGQSYHVRLLSYLDGEPLTRRKHLPPTSLEALGRVCARISVGLSGFRHPGLERSLQWDLRSAMPVATHMLQAVNDPAIKERIEHVMQQAEAVIAPLADALRIQAIHHDITDDNVVARPNPARQLIADGVIDFGDLVYGWLVADLAVACSSMLHHVGGDPFLILPAIRAFHDHQPLTAEEAAALWPLIVQRAGILVASGELQLSVDPDNLYVINNIAHEREILAVATSVPLAVMQQVILAATGHFQAPQPASGEPLLPELTASRITLVPLDSLSPHFHDGNWMKEGLADEILIKAAAGTGKSASLYGEFRLTETRHHSAAAPATTALFVALCLPEATDLAAPFAGVMTRIERGWRIAGAEMSLLLQGVALTVTEGAAVAAGEVIGTAGGQDLLHVQLCRDPALLPPAFVAPHTADAWKALCPSPSGLLGLDCNAPSPRSTALMVSREAHFARSQKNYYQDPPQIERGHRQQMYSVTGRAYLDMVNNVTVVGHGHPRLAEAVGRQWSLLNTNSRFHYSVVADFSARLASLAPEGLDTVFLVNSGSEAVDLALRLAWAHTGARNIISLLEAYHGWTMASDAVSTSIADNPRALTTRPDWVHPVISPNTYRGPFRGPDSAAGYVADVVEELAEIEAVGEKLAGFICESVYGNSGGIPLPKGYLQQVYQLVRARGGVVIADEVQVGYGRLGHYFWGFEQQGVVPDIITIAKGMGNGHPLGAVITTRAIADSMEREGYFFSSAGGSPVSCVVGNTVLDIIAEEGLQQNAVAVGDHLKHRLEALGQRFPIVGAVHGMGLYLGLEFVRDRETLAPATEETEAICNRLLDLGVIMQPTGDHLNILKIKPPMCLTQESADFFADMLARVLEEGW